MEQGDLCGLAVPKAGGSSRVSMFGTVAFASVGELGADLPGGDGHHDGLHGVDFSFRESLVFGHAKV
jgi:hypothetical protein